MPKRYYKHKIENLLNINKIITIHYFKFDKNYKFKGESHDFWEIVYANKSDVICYREDKRIDLYEGSMLFHKPKEFHSIYANEITDSEVFVMTFECKSEAMQFFYNKCFNLNNNLKQYIYTIISEAKKTFNLPQFDPQLNKLELLNSPNLGGQQIIRTNLEQLLIMLMRDALTAIDSDEIFIAKELISGHLESSIIKYLKENIYNKITLDDVCKKFYYGKTYICTEFKKNTGRTIIDYYNNLKISEAKKLIRKDNLSFSQISDLLMFDNQAYFSNTFKKFAQMTPKQYQSGFKGKCLSNQDKNI